METAQQRLDLLEHLAWFDCVLNGADNSADYPKPDIGPTPAECAKIRKEHGQAIARRRALNTPWNPQPKPVIWYHVKPRESV